MSTNTATTPPAAASPTGVASAPATMRAAVQRRYASPEEIHLDSMPVPTAGRGDVLVAVRAAGVDRGVWHLATGRPLVMRMMGFGLRRPKQPVQGSDVAGVVAAVGPGVTRFAVGDEVFGTADGSFAEYAVAKETRLAHVPAGIDVAAAAALPVSAVTAMQAVEDAAAVRAGQRVLVLGAAGGVGHFAVQLAVSAGADVTGVASEAKSEFVRGLGASRVIDYRTTDVTALDEEFDLIIDAGSVTSLRCLRRILSPTGTLVMVGGEGGGSLLGGVGRTLAAPLVSLTTRQGLRGLLSATSAERLERVRALVESGAMRPAIHRTSPLEGAASAVSDLAAGRVRGKTVIVMG